MERKYKLLIWASLLFSAVSFTVILYLYWSIGNSVVVDSWQVKGQLQKIQKRLGIEGDKGATSGEIYNSIMEHLSKTIPEDQVE